MSDPIPIRGPRRTSRGPEPDPALIAKLVLVGLLIAGIWSSWFQVGPESVGIVRRLGRYNGPPRQPGLHFKLPLGIDQYDLVKTQRQLKEEFGFKTTSAGVNSTFASGRGFENESLMLTGDLNVLIVEWTIQYRITDPYRYLFRVRNPEETLRYIAQAVMRELIGDRTVNEVLTVGRTALAIEVKGRLQQLCTQYEIGFAIDQVILQDVTPPDEVKPSFNEVNQAQQQKEQRINEARSEYNREIPKAEGLARQTIEQAEGYAIDRTNRALGEANRFLAVANEYQKAPAVTRQRIYLETMGLVLPKIERKIIIDKDAGNILPLLNLNEGATSLREVAR